MLPIAGFLWVYYLYFGGSASESGNSNAISSGDRRHETQHEAAYIDSAFAKILNSRDHRDSLAYPRKSGRGSPRDTLGSSDGEGNVVLGGGSNIQMQQQQVAATATTFPPRVVSCTSAKSHVKEHLRIPKKAPRTSGRAPWSKGQQRRQDYLRDEAYYNNDDHMAEDPYANHAECVPMHEWQKASYPNCNALHAMELDEAIFVANGFFRDVWVVSTSAKGESEQVAVKTLRLRDSSKLDFDARNYHRHNVDAIAYERLTASTFVMNIFGYCGMSGIFEFAPGGDLSDALSDGNTFTKKERFKTALEVTQAVSDLHNFNRRAPSIAHTDIWHSQIVKTQRGVWALSDFNRAQCKCVFTFRFRFPDSLRFRRRSFVRWRGGDSIQETIPLSFNFFFYFLSTIEDLYWNSTNNATNCPYFYQHTNGYPFRSPEEYSYEAQTEAIDVYSTGNILFSLLMDKWPYEELYKEKNTDAVSKLIVMGNRDSLSTELLESTDPIDVAIRTAMRMCWVHDWRKRASAKEVADFLLDEKSKIALHSHDS